MSYKLCVLPISLTPVSLISALIPTRDWYPYSLKLLSTTQLDPLWGNLGRTWKVVFLGSYTHVQGSGFARLLSYICDNQHASCTSVNQCTGLAQEQYPSNTKYLLWKMARTSIILQILEGVKTTESPTATSNRAAADSIEWIFMKTGHRNTGRSASSSCRGPELQSAPL